MSKDTLYVPLCEKAVANHQEPWSVLALEAQFRCSELARLLHRSTRQLRRYSRQRFGCSTQTWLDEQRLQAAVDLLKQENSVKTVAGTLGFKQVSHFSRQFKARYGVPPSRYLGVSLLCDPGCPPKITNGRGG